MEHSDSGNRFFKFIIDHIHTNTSEPFCCGGVNVVCISIWEKQIEIDFKGEVRCESDDHFAHLSCVEKIRWEFNIVHHLGLHRVWS